MSVHGNRARAAVVLAAVALAAGLLVASSTGSTSRSWTWQADVPGAPVPAGVNGSDERRLLVAEGDLALVAASQGGTVAVGTDGGGLAPLTDLAGDDPVVVFAAAAPDGGPQRLVGVARSDVQRVEAVLRDGTTRELPLNEWRAFSYVAPTSSETAIGLVARSSDSGVGVVRVPQTATTLRPTPERACGGSAGPCVLATTAVAGGPSYALFERAEGTLLTRVNQRTLAPVGRPLALDGYRYGPARSPDGTTLAVAVSDRAAVDLIDLERMERVATVPLVQGERTTVRALAWLRDDRLVAVVQRMSAPSKRYVRSRELVVVDPQARRVVARTPITNKLAMHGFGSAGGRLVLLLKPQAPRKTSAMRLVVADAEGKARTTEVVVGRHGSALRGNVLVVEPTGRRAFVLLWALGLDEGRAVEVDLDTLRPVTRTIWLADATPIRAAGVSSLQAIAAGEDHVAATDIIPGRDDRVAGGVFLLDTHSWVARQLDAHARGLAYRDGRVFTFGFDNLSGQGNLSPNSGIGVTAYDLGGRRVYHAYGERNFARVLFAGRYGHGLPQTQRGGVVFDAASGQGIGKLASLHPFRIELVPEATPQPAKRSSSATAPDRIRAFERPATDTDRLPARMARWFQQQGTRLLETREVARYRDGRGRLSRLLVARGVDAKGRRVSCQILVRVHGMGSGCSPMGEFFAPGRLVAASSGRLISGVVADEVARVEIIGSQGHRHPVTLTADGGFIWDCRAYNGCACVVYELRAYDSSGRLVTSQDWRSPSCPKRATSQVTQQSVTPYRFSNEGRPIAIDRSNRLFNGRKVNARLLATHAGRAFYRLRPQPKVECFAVGKASRLGEIGSMGCPGNPGGRPLVEFGHFGAHKPRERPRAFRLEGFAADNVATVVVVDAQGKRLAETVPIDNVYVFNPAPPTARSVIALDANGDRLRPRPVPTVGFPPGLFGPDISAVAPSSIEAPIRIGTDRGVHVSAGKNGVAVFRTGEAEPDVARALRGHASYGCFRLAPTPWDTDSGGLLWRTYQPVVALQIRGLFTPFDGCQIQASYGHRWPDRFDSHSAIEVAFNERARRYFDDRAAARDLALFVRFGEMRRLREKTGSVLWSVVRSRYGDAVVLLARPSDKPPVGKIGVWALGERTIFSEQSATGALLQIELRDGRIVRNNLRELAMVF